MDKKYKIMQGDCLELMKTIEAGSVDLVLTDPPYKYLNHRLESDFDEQVFFSECKRVLSDDGLLVFFGRGSSFYRWNYICEQLGFRFLEEVIWDKGYTSSPVLKISRVHETIAIYAKQNGLIRKNKVPYVEMRSAEGLSKRLDRIKSDLKRILSNIKRSKGLDELNQYLATGVIETYGGHGVSVTLNGGCEKNLRHLTVMNSIEKGFNEKSIISINRHAKNKYHPTEKPVRLMERLLKVSSDKGGIVLDPFMGSGATGLAALQNGRQFIGFEIDDEYFKTASKRLSTYQAKLF